MQPQAGAVSAVRQELSVPAILGLPDLLPVSAAGGSADGAAREGDVKIVSRRG